MKPDIQQVLFGMIWSIDQLQKLIPDGKDWDFRADAIATHKSAAQRLLDSVETFQFPFTARHLQTGETFVPTQIDYANRQVWHQKGQSSDNGEWIDFDEVQLTPNPFFKI